MKKKDLHLGAIYAVKVSGVVVPCRLIAGEGPWTCQNIKTGRSIHVRGAARFRYELESTTAEELERQPGREYKPKVSSGV